jgi:hypothetical protein
MRLKNSLHQFLFLCIPMLFTVCLFSASACAQTSSANPNSPESVPVADSIRQLQLQVQQLQAAMQEMKDETGRYRAETLELRHELQATRAKLDGTPSMPLQPPFLSGRLDPSYRRNRRRTKRKAVQPIQKPLTQKQ